MLKTGHHNHLEGSDIEKCGYPVCLRIGQIAYKTECHMDILQTILEAVWVNGLQLSHKKCLRFLVVAMLATLSVNLVRLARAAFPDVKTQSGVRRIERLLALKAFSVTLVGKAIVRALPALKRYILTMDRTTWELGSRVYNVLAVGICFDGISIPIYFTTCDKRGTTNFAEQIAFMEHVLDIIPEERIECLVADREFGYTNFIRWLGTRHIPYCLRVRENCHVRNAATGKGRKLKVLLASLAVGQSVVLSDAYIVSGNTRVRIYAVRRRMRDGDSLLILATPVGSSFTDRMYRLRWQIETAFRAMKSAGFNMEETHLPLNGRFQNMLVIVLIAYACAFIDGVVKSSSTAIPVMRNSGRRRFSLFTWGLDFVIADILGKIRNCESDLWNRVT